MSALQAPTLSFTDLRKRHSPLDHPRTYPGYTGSLASINDENDLEAMMTDSAIAGTPPLDPQSDSGEDDDLENSEWSPVTPIDFHPASTLQRKRKDSQEHPTAVHLLDRSQRQQELEQVSAPAMSNYGKGAQGRRPTVTFDLDMGNPSSKPLSRESARLILKSCQRSSHTRVNDHYEESVENTLSGVQFQDKTSAGSESESESKDIHLNDSILQAENALRRVSISPIQDDDSSTAEQAQDPSLKDASDDPQENILNHIYTESAPQDMLVALFDRSSELQELATRNSEFFNLMYSSLPKDSREKFKSLLFQPREALSDRDWMHSIAAHLGPLPPCILEKFKGIVGWIGPEDDDDANVLWGEDEYGYRDSSFENVQIKWLRDIEDFSLEDFQECYPQFFINARERLQGRRMSHGGDQRDHYLIFCETLGLTRQDLPCDNAWTRRMNGCLDKHPELMLQLKEIIAYESGYD